MSRSIRKFRRQDGNAASELAVLMTVFVPVVMYSMMLNDMMHHRLDLQEVVISSAWDYTSFSYYRMDSGQISGSADALKLLWCDHSGSVDGESITDDCDGRSGDVDKKIHGSDAVAAHRYWKGNGAEEINCSVDTNYRAGELKLIGFDPYLDKATEFTSGGLVKCKAAVNVYNTFLPVDFNPTNSETPTKFATKERMEGEQLKQAENLNDNKDIDHWTYTYDYALMTDTWAIDTSGADHWGNGSTSSFRSGNRGGTVNTNTDTAQFKRSKHWRSDWPSGLADIPWMFAQVQMWSFFQQGASDEFFFYDKYLYGWSFMPSILGHNSAQFEMTAMTPRGSPARQSRDGWNMYSTPYEMPGQTDHEYRVRYNKRAEGAGQESYYMGCRKPYAEGC